MQRTLWPIVNRLLAEVPDQDLLERFFLHQDQEAFAQLVTRYNRLVWGQCRNLLANDADADDAFQATFLTLARSAKTQKAVTPLGPWLHGVAYRVCMNARRAIGRRVKRENASARPDAQQPVADSSWEKAFAVVAEEVQQLPETQRVAFVLCYLEGRSVADAAAGVGLKLGTFTARLTRAKQALLERLARRGLGVGILALGGVTGSAAVAPAALVDRTLALLASSVTVPYSVQILSHGVTGMTMKFRFLTALSVTLGLIGGVGAGIYYASADDGSVRPVSKAVDPKSVSGDDAKQASNARGGAPGLTAKFAAAEPGEPDAGTAALLMPYGERVETEGIPLSEVLERIEANTELIVRVDVAAFRRVGAFGQNGEGGTDADQFLKNIYETKAILPRQAQQVPMRDVLADALSQVKLSHPCTYRVRGSQLVIVPAYVPPGRPGVDPLEPNSNDKPMVQAKILNEQIYGGVVSVSATRKPLDEILSDLRKQTDANIVVDPRCQVPDKAVTLTVTLSDVRLYDALRVIADLAEQKLVYTGNIYYLTTPANAKLFLPTALPSPSISLPQPAPEKILPQPAPEKQK